MRTEPDTSPDREQTDSTEQSDPATGPDQVDTPDLGPKPEAEIEPREPAPGGVDAAWDGPHTGPITPDLSTADNPAVDSRTAPAEMQEGQDTSTEATRSEHHNDDTTEEPTE